METYDARKAARVWQRVQGAETGKVDAPTLLSMITQEWEDGGIYLNLSRQVQGTYRAILYKMFLEEQTHSACLKGIYTLLTGSHPKVRPQTPNREPVRVTLRRCYGREMRALARYEAMGNDPEYGQVFLRLAAQEREHCKTILQLLGSLPVRS